MILKDLEGFITVDSGMIGILKKYFRERDDVAFAFLFGSAVRSRVRREGDIDIAVYFWPEKDIEWENGAKRYEGENRIALDLEKLLKKEVDLVILNRAKAVLADEAIRRGAPLVVKDRGLFLEFLCLITDEAEHMREWIETSYRERHVAANR
jgi:predicted nucleotidyltransferase